MWMWIRIALYVVLTVICVWYGRFVRCAGTGTGFYRIWFIAAAGFGALAVMAFFRVWGRVPKWAHIAFVAVIAIGLALFAFVEILILLHYHAEEKDVDYLIVLGAQVRDDGPSPVLVFRLNKAAEYLKDHPNTRCIVSGGKGDNEPVSEAEAMRDYLVAHGVDASRIELEDRSVNTAENLSNCLQMLPSADVSVGIVTNNFHMYRALGIATRCGYGNVTGIASGSNPKFLVHNMVREFFGVVKDVTCGNMNVFGY